MGGLRVPALPWTQTNIISLEWAGGETDFSGAPYTMQIRSASVTDYSTGKAYKYGDKSGKWESIEAVDGKVHGAGTPGSGPKVESSIPPAEATLSVPPKNTEAPTSAPAGDGGIYPWLPSDAVTALPTTVSTALITGIAGLPTSWLVTEAGSSKLPNSASVREPPPSLTLSFVLSHSQSAGLISCVLDIR